MSTSDKILLKTFWEAVEQRLAACSTEELRAIVRAMAQETSSSERHVFLEKLGRTAGTAAASAQEAIQQDELLADIDDLTQELKEDMAGAEPWEERYEWDEYDDEDSLGPYKEYVEPLVELFDRAEAAFDLGDLALARAALQKLFQALSLEDEYGRGVSMADLSGVDAGEACARYLRAVYETEPSEGRPQALFEHMRRMRPGLMGPRPRLEDLIQISPRSLPGQERFMGEWIAFLRGQSGSEADAWLREAVRLSQGTAGLEALARAEGQAHPRAYLDWFAALEQEGKDREVFQAAQGALQALPEGLAIRAAIADHLCAAAARLDETETLRAGRWEAYRAQPVLGRLLDLWEVAPAGIERPALMRQALQYARDYAAHPPGRRDEASWGMDDLERPVWIDKPLLAHACLLAQDLEAARQLVGDGQVLGWSGGHNPQGLVVSFFMAALSGRSPGALPPNLEQLWHWNLLSSAGLWVGAEQHPTYERLERAYAEQFAEAHLSEDSQADVLAWCLDVARCRVEGIVGGQRRGSYDKAAVLTVACAEMLRLRGDAGAADSLVAEIRGRFPRHRNFQAEMETAARRMKRGSL